jgi:broad specificity phosphatase PhoE
MMGSTEVWLVRHGETAWSLTRRHSGRTDLPLTAHGEEEAGAAAQLLGGRKFDQVWCSPLVRARRSCEIAGYLAAARIDPDLEEWDYGDWTGLTLEQVQERCPGWNVWDGPVPGGESIEEIAARAGRVVERLREAGGTVAVFAHGHFLRVLTTQWLGLPPQAGRNFALETSSVCILGQDAGFPAIRAWNLKNGARSGQPVWPYTSTAQ